MNKEENSLEMETITPNEQPTEITSNQVSPELVQNVKPSNLELYTKVYQASVHQGESSSISSDSEEDELEHKRAILSELLRFMSDPEQPDPLPIQQLVLLNSQEGVGRELEEKEEEEREVHEIEIPSTHSVFDLLPNETLFRIWLFLDVPSIGRSGQVCRRFRDMSYDLMLWKELCRIEHWDFRRFLGVDYGYFSAANNRNDYSRNDYIRKYLAFRQLQRENEEKKNIMRRNQKREKRKKQAGFCMNWFCFCRPLEWLLYLCVVLLTILSALKLDGQLDVSWPVVFVPLYVILFHFTCTIVSFDFFHSYFDEEFSILDPTESSWSNCPPLFLFFFVVQPFADIPKTARFIFYPTLTLFIIWVALGSASLMNPDDPVIPWWAVFIPLLLACTLLSQLVLWTEDTVIHEDYRLDRILPCCGACLCSLFIVLLFLQLDGIMDWSWYAIMAPLFLIQLCIFCLPCIVGLSALFTQCCVNYPLNSRWTRSPLQACLLFCLVFTLICAPLLAFQVLIAENLSFDENISYSLVFIPLFFIEFVAFCVCCVATIAFSCH